MENKREFVYLIRNHKLEVFTIAVLANYAHMKHCLKEYGNSDEYQDISLEKTAQCIADNFNLGYRKILFNLDDKKRTPLILYLNKAGRVEKIDVTEFNKTYGPETAQWLSRQPGIKREYIFPKEETLSSAEIYCALINFAERKSKLNNQPVTPKAFEEQIKEILEQSEQYQTYFPIDKKPHELSEKDKEAEPIVDLETNMYLEDPTHTLVQFTFSKKSFAENAFVVDEFDVTEYNKIYGKNAGRKAINEYISETAQTLEK